MEGLIFRRAYIQGEICVTNSIGCRVLNRLIELP